MAAAEDTRKTGEATEEQPGHAGRPGTRRRDSPGQMKTRRVGAKGHRTMYVFSV